MNPYFEISNRKIGLDYPPLVIAEIGINHGGSLVVAMEMVDAAFRAGVEVVKHQTHIVEDEMSIEALQVIPGNSNKSIFQIMDSCALNENDEFKLKNYVESKGMIFVSTPFSRAAVDRLIKWDVPAFKIGSGECSNYPLINYIASFGKPVILSTGMNTIDSIRKAVNILKQKNVPFALLHTTNLYPTPNRLVRLNAMNQLNQEFEGAIVGLSDHTITNHACLGAVALGASILERHFTDKMTRQGPDIICSMDEEMCKDLILGSRILFEQRGGEKAPTLEEQVTIDFAFASVCTIKPIKAGDLFSENNIWVKRPGQGGIPAEQFNDIIGRKAKNDIDENIQLKLNDIL